jgi:serine/threonine protein kinase
VDFGHLLVERGLISDKTLEDALAIQRRSIVEGIDPIPRLGEILIERGAVSEQQVADALAAQNKKILACSNCKTQVNVEERVDAAAYKCARCGREMKEPERVSSVSVIDTSVILVAKDPVPREVEAAAQDAARRMGKYVLLEELGRGGAAIVHRAWDTYLHQFVALKFLKAPPATADPEAQAKYESLIHDLLKEARNAIRLRHPNIVTVYDVGRLERHFFIAMDCLNGRTLLQLIREAREKGRVSPFYDDPAKFVMVMRDICRAVQYAHSRQVPVIHCDLKPSNIFIDQTWRPYVLDFGLAREMEAERRASEEAGVRGTPAYMAPEQASGESTGIDARTDIYGLGSILYELLTGRPPFTGELLDVLHKVVNQTPQRPSEVLAAQGNGHRAAAPSTLEWICMKCLEKAKDRRYQTAMDLAQEFEHVLMSDAHTVRLEASARVAPSGAEAAPKLSAPSIQVPESPIRPLGKVPFYIAIAVLATLALWLAVRPMPAPRGEGAIRRQLEEVRVRLDHLVEAFQVEAARDGLKEAAAASGGQARDWIDHQDASLEWVQKLKVRLIEGINARTPRYRKDPFRLRAGSLPGVEIVYADARRIVAVSGNSTKDVPWAVIDPSQVREMAAALLGPGDHSARLGLAIYCLRTGQVAEARKLLESLAGTELEIPSRPFLREVLQ